MNQESGSRRVSEKTITKKQFRQLYPNGGFDLVGEIAIKGSKEDDDATTFIDTLDGRRAVLPLRTLGRFWRAVGYLPYGDEEHPDRWLVVKANRLPLTVVGIALLLLALIAALVLAVLFAGPELDPFAKKYSNPELNRPDGTPSDQIAIPGYTAFKLPVGTTELHVPLANSEGNPCYMQYSIMLDETQEVLYESKLIPPGEAVTDFSISHDLPAGTHPITVKIDTFDINDYKKPLNGAEVATNIEVR